MKSVDEKLVLQFYIDEINKGNIHFINNRGDYKSKLEECINKLIATESNHDRVTIAKEIWKILFDASMSYIDPDKRGYDKLFSYFDEYVNFEELIFASDSFYRDHTLHCLWVYFLGEYLFRNDEFSYISKKMKESTALVAQLIDEMEDCGLTETLKELYEHLKQLKMIPHNREAVRCISALIHDLGYPLKKIAKINKSISTVLPYFSIKNSNEYNFEYSSLQQKYINEFIEILSKSIHFQLSTKDNGNIDKESSERIEKIFLFTNGGLEGFDKEAVEALTEEDHRLLSKEVSNKCYLSNNLNDKIRYSHDFEEYNHGIMSAFLIHKTVKSMSNLDFSVLGDEVISSGRKGDFMSKMEILKASIDHTSESYQIQNLEDTSAFLTFIDELEEFSRITRADQNRQFINEFCKTGLSWSKNTLNVDFLFDNDEIPNLNPELAFKGKCRRMIHLIDIKNFDPEMKIRFSFIGDLPSNKNCYVLELGRQLVKIEINGDEQHIPSYLKSSQYYTTEEYAQF